MSYMPSDNLKLKSSKLIAAIANNDDFDNIKKIINDGANINEHDGYALRLAALNGNLDVVKYLVKMGVDVTNINYLSNFDLMVVENVEGHYEIAQFLRLCRKEDKMSQNLVKIMLRDVSD